MTLDQIIDHIGVEPYYREDAGVIYCADCLSILPKMPEKCVDALITDPPFAFTGGHSMGRSSMIDDQFFLHWWHDICKLLKRKLKDDGEGFIWTDWRTVATMAKGFVEDQKYTWRLAQVVYHYRQMPGQGRPFRSSVDMIAYIRGPRSTGERIPNTTQNWLSDYWYYGKHENHPAEKNVAIAEQLIKWSSDEDDLILDNFMGSGSVILGTKQLGRKFIGIEIEEKYCKIAVQRLAQGVMGI